MPFFEACFRSLHRQVVEDWMELSMTRLFVVACSVFVLCGCGSEGRVGDQPVFTVTGTVTYKGEPVSGADVIFFPQGKEDSAFGRTDDKGVYRLTTFAANDGAIEGRHLVAIIKAPPVAPPAKEADTESEEYVPPEIGKAATPPPIKSEIPQKYASSDTSGLVAVVKPEGDNQIDFPLED